MRQRKPEAKHHVFRATELDDELIFVGGKQSAFLWIGPARGADGRIYTFSGVKALRALARAILRETTPKPKPRGRKK